MSRNVLDNNKNKFAETDVGENKKQNMGESPYGPIYVHT
jgi:hypothetical protein